MALVKLDFRPRFWWIITWTLQFLPEVMLALKITLTVSKGCPANKPVTPAEGGGKRQRGKEKEGTECE